MTEEESMRGQFFITEEAETEDGEAGLLVIFHGLIHNIADRVFGRVAQDQKENEGSRLIMHEDEMHIFEDLRRVDD